MLTLGTRGTSTLSLTPEQRSRHVHVIGASGTGKSKFLEYMIRQDILAGRGVCLIDPHGTLADEVVRFCASINTLGKRRVHVIEPSHGQWCAGFNPLHTDDRTDTQLRVDAMVDACAEVWGGENVNDTPLLTTCLQLVFYALITHRLTLVEAVALTRTADPEGIRRMLTEKLPDSVYTSYWDDFNGLPRREFEERFSSTRRRLLRFLGKPLVRRMLGQTERVLDLGRIMDEGDILIVNLAPKGAVSPQTGRLIGALLTSDFYLTALGRTPELARRRPFYLYIDECYDFLTGDIEKMLDQTRKFGLHLVLAHHRLGQLKARSEEIYNGVMAGAQTKIVFGGLTDEDARELAPEIMRDSFDLERPKRSLDRPVVVGDELIWLQSESSGSSTSRGTGEATSSSWQRGESSASSASESFRAFEQASPAMSGLSFGTMDSTSAGVGGAHARNEFSSQTMSSASGMHQALRSRYEVKTIQVHTLEEEVHRAILTLREQRNQRAIVKVRGKKAKGITIPLVREALASRAKIDLFRQAAFDASAYVSSVADVDAEIATRQETMKRRTPPPPEDEAQFWKEEP